MMKHQITVKISIFTFASEAMFSSVSACLMVGWSFSTITQKSLNVFP